MARSILITGATRGLGQALARQFAQRGYRLALTGRSAPELESLAEELQSNAERVCTRLLDVTDYDAVSGVISDCAAELGAIDVVVVNAGVAFETPAGKRAFDRIKATIDVNLLGAIASSEAAIELFRKQGHGHLVGITSVAAARGLPGQSAYSASKAGFGKYLESVRCDTWEEAITVTELAPGYIDTDLNRALEKRPFLVSAEKGTGIMADLIEKRVRVSYVPPWPWSLIARVMKLLPISLLRTM
jgi:NAD(P)-dependent dehydrogenase (short-subunit alcohol dehydrogenase family)